MLFALPLLVLLAALPTPAQGEGAPASPEAPEAPDAPEVEERGLLLRSEGAFEGYTLYAPLRSTTTYLVDLDGEVVHSWPSTMPPGNSVYLLDDGTLLRCGRVDGSRMHAGGAGGRVQLLAPDGAVLWDLEWCDDDRRHHHDIEPLPNGNVLLISWVWVAKEDAVRLGRDPEHVSDDGFWPDSLYEVRPVPPDGHEVVWEWHALDHLVQDFDPDAPGYGDVTAHPGRIDLNADHRDEPPLTPEERARREELESRMRALGYLGGDDGDDGDGDDDDRRRTPGDWLHVNGIDWLPQHDLIALSVRTLSEVWVIDHSTTSEEAAGSTGGRWGRGGDLLWRWGNPRTYGAGGDADRQLFVQHDARWIHTGEAADVRMTVFNNGEGRPGEPYSSVDELVLPFDPETGFARPEPGEAFAPAAPAWTYTAPERASFFSSFISGAQRLPNGNTLICSGAQGRIFEVTRAGELVWDYLNPHGGDVEMGARGGDRDEQPDGDGDGGEGGDGDGDDRPRRGPGGMLPTGLFQAKRLPADHPGIVALLGEDAER